MLKWFYKGTMGDSTRPRIWNIRENDDVGHPKQAWFFDQFSDFWDPLGWSWWLNHPIWCTPMDQHVFVWLEKIPIWCLIETEPFQIRFHKNWYYSTNSVCICFPLSMPWELQGINSTPSPQRKPVNSDSQRRCIKVCIQSHSACFLLLFHDLIHSARPWPQVLVVLVPGCNMGRCLGLVWGSSAINGPDKIMPGWKIICYHLFSGHLEEIRNNFAKKSGSPSIWRSKLSSTWMWSIVQPRR